MVNRTRTLVGASGDLADSARPGHHAPRAHRPLGTSPGGHLFRTARGGPLNDTGWGEVWQRALPATEVARRAGHGVAVLLKVYANCIDGQAGAANQRIGDALGEPGSE